MTTTLFVLSIALLAVYGSPAAFHPATRHWPLSARTGAAFGLGAIAISLSAIVLGIAGIPANALTLSILPLIGAALLVRRTFRAGAGAAEPPKESRRPVALVLGVIGLALAFAAIYSGRANSPDFLYFWGIKAIRYVAASGFDPAFLRWPNAIHTHVNYPPLYPITLAWSAFWGGEEALWRFGPVMSVVWVAATAPVLFALLRERLRRGGAAAVTAFWTAAISTAVAASYSGGNAEATLLFFVTIAAAALLVDVAALRIVAAFALSGLVLTKLEGIVAAAILLGAVFARDLLLRRPRPWTNAMTAASGAAVSLVLWYAYMLIYRIPLTDPTREPLGRITFEWVGVIITEQLRHLAAGTYGLSWLFPLVLVLISWRRAARAHLPGLLFTAGLLLFYFVYYLHAHGNPATLIGWTLPRTSLPALSVWIVTAGLIGASRTPNLRPM